ncbi:hypothetical protein HFO99_21255 [Rhizobium leguminosarum]|nr:hypothetical protein [Rhizobium leguminosarum]
MVASRDLGDGGIDGNLAKDHAFLAADRDAKWNSLPSGQKSRCDHFLKPLPGCFNCNKKVGEFPALGVQYRTIHVRDTKVQRQQGTPPSQVPTNA